MMKCKLFIDDQYEEQRSLCGHRERTALAFDIVYKYEGLKQIKHEFI